MPLYRYIGIGKEGRKIEGAIDGDTVEIAKEKLFRQSIYLLQIAQEQISLAKPLLKEDALLQFTKELSRLLKAGLPLLESLQAMEEKYRGQSVQKLLLDLGEKIRNGSLLSLALSNHSRTFDLLYVGMVANAEKSGRLSEALDEIATLLSKRQKVKKQLVATFLYPTLLLSFCGIVLSVLLFHVVPSLREIFEGRELHPMTRFVFAWSDFVIQTKLFWMILILGLIVGGCFLKMTEQGRRWSYQVFSKLPGLSSLLAKLSLIRFFRAGSTLIEGGVSFLAAIQQARKIMKHPTLEAVVEKAEITIAEGNRVAQSFTHPLIPSLVPRLLGIGEEGGDLGGMMKQIAEIFEEELEQLLAQFSTMAQPILLIFLGGVVGFILLSILLPLTDTGSMTTF